jgi:predicted DNA-binding protein (MmcQ/YjbR family)
MKTECPSYSTAPIMAPNLRTRHDKNSRAHKQLSSLRRFALSLPEAWEDFPFGHPVIKIGKRPFVYLGVNREGAATIAVKLPHSKKQALKLRSGTPTAYGLGRGGWITIAMRQADTPKEDVLRAWIQESYREMLKPNPAMERSAMKAAASVAPKKPPTQRKASRRRTVKMRVAKKR